MHPLTALLRVLRHITVHASSVSNPTTQHPHGCEMCPLRSERHSKPHPPRRTREKTNSRSLNTGGVAMMMGATRALQRQVKDVRAVHNASTAMAVWRHAACDTHPQGQG